MQLANKIGANRLVVALSVARLGDAVGNSILFIIIPLYVAKLPAPWLPFPESVRAGLVVSVFGLITAAIQPLAGALSDYFDRHKVFIQAGLLLMAASTFSFVLASHFLDVLIFRILQGIGLGLTIPPSMALMAAASEKATRGGSMGIYTSTRMFGFTIGPLLGGYLHDHLGVNAAFYMATSLLGLAMILVHAWVHDQSTRSTDPAETQSRFIDRQLLNRGIVGAATATFVMASAFSMMTPLERQFNARLHQSAFAFSIAFSVLMVSRLLLQFPFGRLSDRWGRKPLIIGGLLLMAPATALLGDAQTTLELIGLRILQGIGSAGIAAPAFALAADLSSSGGEGRQMSIITMGFGLGIAIGPLLAGVLAVPDFRLPFIIVGLALVISAWGIQQFVPETVRRSGS